MAKKKKPRPSPTTLGLPAGGVDSHAHLDMERFEGGIPETLARAHAAGVDTIGNVFLGPDAYERSAALFEAFPEVYFILGVHPGDADTCTPDALQRMARALDNDPRIRAVGEIGLDFYWDKASPEAQDAALRAQLDLARRFAKPVVIHSRQADQETLAVLEAEGFMNQPVLWHCFGGDGEMARKVLERGWHLSVPGNVTYKGSDNLVDAVLAVRDAGELGLSRLLLETDCPFLAPEPYRGKQNEPSLLGFTAVKVAELLGTDAPTVWRRTAGNAREFFRI